MDITDALAREESWRRNTAIRMQPSAAREVSAALADRVRELEQQVALLQRLAVGTRVFIHRGNPDRGPETGPGFGRKIPAVIEAAPVGVFQVQCRLLVDDPDAVGSPNRAGESGFWSISQITHE